jgi:TnpA family transposase
MTAIERTAYPRFKSQATIKELTELYTPSASELAFAQTQVKSKRGLLRLLVMLKSFQRLGYFPPSEAVPPTVVGHIRACLNLSANVCAIPPERSRYYYAEAIRAYLGVHPYDRKAQTAIATAIAQAAEVMEYPADLINVAVEELVKERYELPAFSTLDRLVGHIRTVVNNRLFGRITNAMTPIQQAFVDDLLATSPASGLTFSLLRAPPKSARLSHVQALQAKFEQMLTCGDVRQLLVTIAPVKVKSFAAQAKALALTDLRELKLAKRRALLVCLLYRVQVKTRDHLVEMFLKRVQKMHQSAKDKLVKLREQHLAQTESMLGVLAEILQTSAGETDTASLGERVQSVLETHGGAVALLEQCEEITAYNSDNYLPLVWRFYSRYRSVLFPLVRGLEIQSTSQDLSLTAALTVVLAHEDRRAKWLPVDDLDLSFMSERWRRLVVEEHEGKLRLVRQQFEVCIFTYLAAEFKSGDACVVGSENYADFREQLLSWDECQPLLADYCQQTGMAPTAAQFVEQLQTKLTETATTVDQICKDGTQITISADGEPVLKRIAAAPPPSGAKELEAEILQRLPERSVLDILCHVEHWLNWVRHFGPVSGSEPKIENSVERYILAVFGYGCNLGPNQTARHTRGKVSSRMLAYVNRQHISIQQIEAAMRDLINAYNLLELPKCWGTGKKAAADGSKFEVYENNLMSEYHIRYGGYGGIAYHHVSDTYIALFTHFINCGVWEAVYILDGLLKNTSDLQPDTLHVDTQGQSTTVFGLSYLLGIKLMPRIRNWQDYKFFRPSQDAVYEYIDPLFKDVIDWQLIRTHWQDLMRVVLSIQAGKFLPSMLLRKLGSYSRKNRLYQAFRELGRVVRTVFLLEYISDRSLRREITACTNIVEGYNHFLDWIFFGKEGIITENDPEQQEKRVKYLDLVASAVILHNAVDLSVVIQQLTAEGVKIDRAMLATLSPYLTGHLKRYGDFVIDLQSIPAPMEGAIHLPIASDLSKATDLDE